MERSKILPIIQKLVNSDIFQARIEGGKLKEVLSEREVGIIIEKEIAKPIEVEPSRCERCYSLDIDVQNLGNRYLVKCNECGKIYNIDKKTYFDISYLEIARQITENLNLECEILEDRDFYIVAEFEWDNSQFLFLFLPTKLEDNQLLLVFHEILHGGRHVLCVAKDVVLSNALSLLSLISSGSMIYITPISQINEEDITKWLEKTVKIRNFENNILDRIDDEKLRNLIISVNTNPKYALTLLMHLKTLKKIEKKYFDWELLENLVSTVFRQLYSSDVSFGGGRDRGKRLPDNVFLVRDREGKPIVLGLVDCKSSERADFDKELTEKHVSYLERANKIDFLRPVDKALIFVTFDVKGNSVIRFYNRLENELKEREYIVILPVDTLNLILELYLNVIIRGELKLKDVEDTLENTLARLFTLEYLRELKQKYKETNEEILAYEKIFRINQGDVIKELEKKASSVSSVETILKMYKEREI